MGIDFASLGHSIAEALEKTGNARAIFGDPIKLDTCTIVPVVGVTMALGGGGGHWLGGDQKPEAESKRSFFGRAGGSGGGGELNIVPLGYIHEKDGVAMFTAIAPPATATARIAHRGHDAPTNLWRSLLRGVTKDRR